MDARTGILYVAMGEAFVAEAEEAAETAARHMPDIPIRILGAEDFPAVSQKEFERLVGHADVSRKHCAFFNKIVALEHSPFARTVFLDSDTRVCAPLYELFEITTTATWVAAAYAPHRSAPGNKPEWWLPAHNSGVIAYRRSHKIFEVWRSLYLEGYKPERADYSDQSVFDQTLHTIGSRGFGYASLPEELNYRVSAIAKLHGPVKVLHGRDHAKLEAAERFVNSVRVARLVIPEVGMVWIEKNSYWWMSYDRQEPKPLARRDIVQAFDGIADASPNAAA